MTVKQRLNAFIKSKKLSQRKFEKAVGLSNGYVNNISKNIGAEKLQNIISIFPDLNTTWLLTGEGEMLKYHVSDIIDKLKKYLNFSYDMQLADYLDLSVEILQNWKINNTYDKKLIKEKIPLINIDVLLYGEYDDIIPFEKTDTKKTNQEQFSGYYYPDISASAGLDFQINNSEFQKKPIFIPGWGNNLIFINVFGDSMYPKYNSGEIIAIKEVEFKYINYGHPYVVVFVNGDSYIKYIKKGKDDKHVLLSSENKNYEPKEFNLELIKSVYSIKGVIKKELM